MASRTSTYVDKADPKFAAAVAAAQAHKAAGPDNAGTARRARAAIRTAAGLRGRSQMAWSPQEDVRFAATCAAVAAQLAVAERTAKAERYAEQTRPATADTATAGRELVPAGRRQRQEPAA